MNFKDQTAVVTGGAQGIGRACAERIVGDGGRIAVWDIDLEMAEQAAAALGNASFACAVDVSDWASVEAARDATLARAGRIDILINSAGIAGSNAPLETYPVEEFARIQAINVMGTFHADRAVVPPMKAQGYGRIVNIASVAGKEGNPNASAYSASKAAVIGLTKSLGKELADLDIAVNCVTPAAARTRIFEQMSQEHIDFMLSKIPRGRFLETAEAAAMIAWLASAENSFATGAVFDLSGGRATY
ncbi:MAG: SDR family oxidoreductase [Rhodobacteraceae bacterium]|nr:SDR family oxidoreductase [Paracoccaceae bacterium]